MQNGAGSRNDLRNCQNGQKLAPILTPELPFSLQEWIRNQTGGRGLSLTKTQGSHFGKESETDARGRVCGFRPLVPGQETGGWTDLDFCATIRAAAPWQLFRRNQVNVENEIFRQIHSVSPENGKSGWIHPAGTETGSSERIHSTSAKNNISARIPQTDLESGRMVDIRAEDMRIRRRKGRVDTGILFVVDASRSQGAEKRLAYAKGAVLSLTAEAYCTREKIGLIAFGNRKSELLLPFTGSVEFAGKHLLSLSAAGNTPLGMGLRQAYRVIENEKRKNPQFRPFLILLTDGRANYDCFPGEPFALAMEAARKIRFAAVPSLVIDTERGYFSMGLARKVAEALGGTYLQMD